MNSCEREVKTAGEEYIDLAFQGLTFVPTDCEAWIIQREANGPLNMFEALKGLFPLLTGRDPPFGEALDWLQFAYDVDQVGDYVAPASTLISHSAVAEVDELYPTLLVHLRRIYTELYSPEVSTGWAPEHREFQIVEGGGLSGRTSVNIIQLGAYAGRFTNINIVGMNNLSPTLTAVYLYTPLLGPTPEPLEYVSLPGRIEQPSRYPLISTGGGPYTGGSKRHPPPPPPPYSTHPQMNHPTGWAQPRRVVQPATSPDKKSKFGNKRGTPVKNIDRRGQRGLTPPTYTINSR